MIDPQSSSEPRRNSEEKWDVLVKAFRLCFSDASNPELWQMAITTMYRIPWNPTNTSEVYKRIDNLLRTYLAPRSPALLELPERSDPSYQKMLLHRYCETYGPFRKGILKLEEMFHRFNAIAFRRTYGSNVRRVRLMKLAFEVWAEICLSPIKKDLIDYIFECIEADRQQTNASPENPQKKTKTSTSKLQDTTNQLKIAIRSLHELDQDNDIFKEVSERYLQQTSAWYITKYDRLINNKVSIIDMVDQMTRILNNDIKFATDHMPGFTLAEMDKIIHKEILQKMYKELDSRIKDQGITSLTNSYLKDLTVVYCKPFAKLWLFFTKFGNQDLCLGPKNKDTEKTITQIVENLSSLAQTAVPKETDNKRVRDPAIVEYFCKSLLSDPSAGLTTFGEFDRQGALRFLCTIITDWGYTIDTYLSAAMDYVLLGRCTGYQAKVILGCLQEADAKRQYQKFEAISAFIEGFNLWDMRGRKDKANQETNSRPTTIQFATLIVKNDKTTKDELGSLAFLGGQAEEQFVLPKELARIANRYQKTHQTTHPKRHLSWLHHRSFVTVELSYLQGSDNVVLTCNLPFFVILKQFDTSTFKSSTGLTFKQLLTFTQMNEHHLSLRLGILCDKKLLLRRETEDNSPVASSSQEPSPSGSGSSASSARFKQMDIFCLNRDLEVDEAQEMLVTDERPGRPAAPN